MNQSRRLQLRREVLAELTPEELVAVAGGERPTDGTWCPPILVGTAIITAATAIADLSARLTCFTCIGDTGAA